MHEQGLVLVVRSTCALHRARPVHRLDPVQSFEVGVAGEDDETVVLGGLVDEGVDEAHRVAGVTLAMLGGAGLAGDRFGDGEDAGGAGDVGKVGVGVVVSVASELVGELGDGQDACGVVAGFDGGLDFLAEGGAAEVLDPGPRVEEVQRLGPRFLVVVFLFAPRGAALFGCKRLEVGRRSEHAVGQVLGVFEQAGDDLIVACHAPPFLEALEALAGVVVQGDRRRHKKYYSYGLYLWIPVDPRVGMSCLAPPSERPRYRGTQEGGWVFAGNGVRSTLCADRKKVLGDDGPRHVLVGEEPGHGDRSAEGVDFLVAERSRGIVEGGEDVLSFQLRVLVQNLADLHPRGQKLQNELDGHAGSADDGLPGQDVGVRRDAILGVHRHGSSLQVRSSHEITVRPPAIARRGRPIGSVET